MQPVAVKVDLKPDAPKEGGCPMAAIVPSTKLSATAAGACVGSIVGGTTGAGCGTLAGAAAGVVPAIFTFGLSIPIGATIGFFTGAATGGSAGAVGGGATGFLGFKYKKEIKEAAKQGKEFVVAEFDTNWWKFKGEQFYRFKYENAGPGSRCPVIRALNANTFCNWTDVQPRLAGMDAAIQKGDLVRHNWLGPAELAEGVMVDGVFGLGQPAKEHEIVRAWLDRTLWGSAQKWSPARIRATAKKFVNERKVLKLTSDAKQFAVHILAQEWLRLKVPQEFDPAEFVRDYQSWRFILAVAPNVVQKLPIVRGLAQKVRQKNEDYVAIISKAIERAYPEDIRDKELRLLAAGALDALCFAGGLSVGEICAKVLGALWNKTGALGEKDFLLTEANIDEVICETMRLYPSVANIPYERIKPYGKGPGSELVGREILAISPVLQDPNYWGSDAAEFKLRGAEYKQPYYVPFGNGATKRSCPGQDIAMSMIRSLVLETNRRPWQMQKKWIHNLPLPWPANAPVGVGPTKVWFWGYANEDFTIEFVGA